MLGTKRYCVIAETEGGSLEYRMACCSMKYEDWGHFRKRRRPEVLIRIMQERLTKDMIASFQEPLVAFESSCADLNKV